MALEITNSKNEKYYKVFATWSGAMHERERWRLSSGSDELNYETDQDGNYLFPQYTSTYCLEPRLEGGFTLYAKGIWNRLRGEIESDDCLVKIINLNVKLKTN
ncbi:hypothetical protein AB4140_04790 [Shewanella sp. 10N.286.51.B2]|uniref:hypothetical protein n=1 Tax=Shewanella sp. 10N.286.51.B2 TaxID=3229707 RepID=UPI0035526B57